MTRADRHRPHDRGFSLVEVLVTFAVVGLMLLVAVPSMGTWTRNAQIRNAAESLQNGLNRARMEAVRRNAPVRFTLVSTNAANTLDSSCAASSSSASWIVSLQDPAGKCDVLPSDTTAPMTIEKWVRNDGAASITVAVKAADCSTAATATSVIFDGYGRVASGSTPIRCLLVNNASAASDNRPLRVLVSGSNVRMCDPASTLAATDPRRC